MSREEITAATIAAAEANFESRGELIQDRSYAILQKRYLDWVDVKVGSGRFDYDEWEESGKKYFQRAYIDLYFQEEIAGWIITPETARRAVSALQKLADHLQNSVSAETFIVEDSTFVRSALDTSKKAYLARQTAQNRISDPHANLKTNQLIEENKIDFVKQVMLSRKEYWPSATQCFTGCEQMMLRMNSMLKMRLSDLHYNNTHAPNQGEAAPDSGMLCLVYQAMTHKERNTSKHVVGCWRHKNITQCFTSMAAMAFFVSHRTDTTLHFRREDDTQPAPWWKTKLVTDWGNTRAAGRAYQAVFTELGLNPEKCTHVRRSGTEYASAQGGLSACVIGSMTKHKSPNQSTLESHYMTELHRSVLECMSGFARMEGEYFVARTRIPVEEWFGNMNGKKGLTRILFPNYDGWIEQRDDDVTGDNSSCAQNFLDEVVPFFAKVIVQDACFWIVDYPHHHVTQLLFNALPAEFANRAAAARIWCAEQDEARRLNQNSLANFQATVVQNLHQIQQAQELGLQQFQQFFQLQLNHQLQEQLGTLLPQFIQPWLQPLQHLIQHGLDQQHQLLLQMQQRIGAGFGGGGIYGGGGPVVNNNDEDSGSDDSDDDSDDDADGGGGGGARLGHAGTQGGGGRVSRGGGGAANGGQGGGGRFGQGGGGRVGREGGGAANCGGDGGGRTGRGGRGVRTGGGRIGGESLSGGRGRGVFHGRIGGGPRDIRGRGLAATPAGVHGVLRSRPLLPPIPAKMPDNLANLVAEWQSHDMRRFITGSKSGWDSTLRNRFSVWKYVYEKVCEKEQAMRNRGGPVESETARLIRAARAIDTVREDLGLSVPQYVKYLKRNDVTLKTRQRNAS
jgi:hypothetical protein